MPRVLPLITVATSTLYASVASAGIIVDYVKIAGEDAGGFPVPEEQVNGTGWSSYQVGLATDDGDLITAVDVRLEGHFHQRWPSGVGCFPFCPSPQGAPSNNRGDSHLSPLGGRLVANPPTEDNNTASTSSPLLDSFYVDYGVGTFLMAAWGIPEASQTDSEPIALIVIPDGSRATFIYDVATRTGRYSGTSRVPVPEPCSTAIAVAALVGRIAPGRNRP